MAEPTEKPVRWLEDGAFDPVLRRALENERTFTAARATDMLKQQIVVAAASGLLPSVAGALWFSKTALIVTATIASLAGFSAGFVSATSRHDDTAPVVERAVASANETDEDAIAVVERAKVEAETTSVDDPKEARGSNSTEEPSDRTVREGRPAEKPREGKPRVATTTEFPAARPIPDVVRSSSDGSARERAEETSLRDELVFFERAEAALGARRHAIAAREFGAFLEAFPGSALGPEARLGRLEALLSDGRVDDVVRALTDVLDDRQLAAQRSDAVTRSVRLLLAHARCSDAERVVEDAEARGIASLAVRDHVERQCPSGAHR